MEKLGKENSPVYAGLLTNRGKLFERGLLWFFPNPVKPEPIREISPPRHQDTKFINQLDTGRLRLSEPGRRL